MAFDRENYGILICITAVATGVNSNYWLDLKTGGFFPESYPDVAGAYSLLFYSATDPTNRKLLVGGKDGYIRSFDRSTKSDATTASTQAISSYVVLPIIQSKDDDMDVKLTSLTLTTAGGKTDGTESDSSTLTVDYFADKSAEAVMESIKDGDAALHTATVAIDANNQLIKLRNRIKGHSIALNLKNSTIDTSWAVERLSAVLASVRRM